GSASEAPPLSQNPLEEASLEFSFLIWKESVPRVASRGDIAPGKPRIKLSQPLGVEKLTRLSQRKADKRSPGRRRLLEERTAAAATDGSKPFSVSKISCKARIGSEGGGEATLGLFRHMAPLTVNAIV